MVAPPRGAWIEIGTPGNTKPGGRSLPRGERGLKSPARELLHAGSRRSPAGSVD